MLVEGGLTKIFYQYRISFFVLELDKGRVEIPIEKYREKLIELKKNSDFKIAANKHAEYFSRGKEKDFWQEFNY